MNERFFACMKSLHVYRVRQTNPALYILEPRGSHRHRTGQNGVSLEPQMPHEDFDISHAQIGQS